MFLVPIEGGNLCHFGIGQGERADSGDLSSEVAGIDYIEINGVSRKRILFKGENSASVWNYWVEGIGAPSGDGLLRRDDFDDMPDVYVPGSLSDASKVDTLSSRRQIQCRTLLGRSTE